jgi:hypothetical protein
VRLSKSLSEAVDRGSCRRFRTVILFVDFGMPNISDGEISIVSIGPRIEDADQSHRVAPTCQRGRLLKDSPSQFLPSTFAQL